MRTTRSQRRTHSNLPTDPPGSCGHALGRVSWALCLAAASCMFVSGGSASFAEDTPPATKASEKGPAVKENRLARERSPYLRQHKNNPVDWYPWGDEAFATAKKQNKLIFLSIGYAACHWCHVMEHESFEDAATAKVMNDAFVCVKVDREERPDIDRVYMNVIHFFRGQGGWPLTVLMLPNGKPFWAGTYLPAARVRELSAQVSALWKKDPKRLMTQADEIAVMANEDPLAKGMEDYSDSRDDLFDSLRTAMKARFDHDHGGYGRPVPPQPTKEYRYHPKFPPHAALLYGLEEGGKRSDEDERTMLRETLRSMADGGIHDHVGGGFHRYSTDREWKVPHFEKMLYDNALLLQAYAAGYGMWKDDAFQRVALRLVAWLDREMKRPGGGYASSLDADTEGVEGTTYTWTLDELKAALGSGDPFNAVVVTCGIGDKGNFLDEATHKFTGRNMLYVSQSFEDAAKAWEGKNAAEVQALYEQALDTLLPPRSKRAQPGLDDKVIVGWNGLLVSALARASTHLGDKQLASKAASLGNVLWATCRSDDGHLLRFPKNSGAIIMGFCEDYVHVIEGFLDLHDIDPKGGWVTRAEALGHILVSEFQDKVHGGFWTSSLTSGETLFAKSKEAWDSPIPSDNGTAARLCLRLSALAKDRAPFAKASARCLRAYRPMMSRVHMAPGLISLFRALAESPELPVVTKADIYHQGTHFTLELFRQRDVVVPGGSVELLVRISLDESWHVTANGKDALNLGLAVDPKLATLTDIRMPTPATQSIAGESVAVFNGVVDLRATLRIHEGVTAGPHKIPLTLQLQPCSTDRCLAAERASLSFSLQVGSKDGDTRHADLWESPKPEEGASPSTTPKDE